MNRADSVAVEAGVASVRDQIQSLVARRRRLGTRATRVRVERVTRPAPGWKFTARLARSRRAVNLWFTVREVELGEDRIVLPPQGTLTIVSAGFKDDHFTLCIAEATRVREGAPQEIADAERLLRLSQRTLEQLTEPTRHIAATRAFRAVSNAIANASVEALTAAASASTDMEVAVRALQQPDAIETLKSEDPLGPARLRGLQERERLLTVEGGTLAADDVASYLKISRQAVNKRRQHGTLVGLDAGRHGYLYPAWQFVREGTLSGLEAVLGALQTADPWMRHIFMVSRNTRLKDATPVERLRQGSLDDVLKAAAAFGEHGAA